MPLKYLYTDQLTFTPPTDSPDGQGGMTRDIRPGSSLSSFTVPGRIEPYRGHSGRRVFSEQGDVPYSTHVAFIPVMQVNEDGTDGPPVVVDIDYSVMRARDGRRFQVAAKPREAWGRTAIDHLELELVEVAGSY